MTVSKRFEIICYFARAGAHATIQFKNQEQYDAAIAFLDKLRGARFGRRSDPMLWPNTDTFFYALESEDEDAFETFMRSA
jgi:hypothetical protein